jgi:uncharacterized membrane protein
VIQRVESPAELHSRAGDSSARPSLDDPAPPWRYNPSAWRERLPICGLAMVASGIAAYMALYQWRLIDGVWDPVFGAQSEQVLDSQVSERMRGWIGIPDAALGALAYLSDAVFGLAGSTRRWQYRPWLVVLFGIDVIPLGIVSAVLVAMQGLVVGSWCLLCLVTAAISLLLVLMAYDEVWSALVYLHREWRRERSARVVWDRFWGRAPAPHAPAVEPRRGSMWARNSELAVGLWLGAAPFVLPNLAGGLAGGSAGSWPWLHDLVCAGAVVLLALLSRRDSTRRAHLAELPIATWLVLYGGLAARETASAASQNQIVVGLLLAMLAIVPTHASAPPRGWPVRA